MLETKIGLIFNHGSASIVINESKDGENDGELWDTNASGTKSINDRPGVAKPSNL